MPLPSTVFWGLFHLAVGLGINYLLKELKLIGHGEFVALYFILLAGRYRDAQVKFSLAYKQDPDLVEAIMRADLEKDNY